MAKRIFYMKYSEDKKNRFYEATEKFLASHPSKKDRINFVRRLKRYLLPKNRHSKVNVEHFVTKEAGGMMVLTVK